MGEPRPLAKAIAWWVTWAWAQVTFALYIIASGGLFILLGMDPAFGYGPDAAVLFLAGSALLTWLMLGGQLPGLAYTEVNGRRIWLRRRR